MTPREPDPTLAELGDTQVIVRFGASDGVPVAHRHAELGDHTTCEQGRGPGWLPPARHVAWMARACPDCFDNVPPPGSRWCGDQHGRAFRCGSLLTTTGLAWQRGGA